MKIRSVTAFTNITWPINEGSIAGIGRFLTDARLRFADAGIEVQTVRLATPPFLDIIGDPDTFVLLEFARILEAMANNYNIDFVSIGPVVATTPLALLMSIHALPDLISQTEKIFSGVLFAASNSGLNLAAAHAFAQTVYKVATLPPTGLEICGWQRWQMCRRVYPISRQPTIRVVSPVLHWHLKPPTWPSLRLAGPARSLMPANAWLRLSKMLRLKS